MESIRLLFGNSDPSCKVDTISIKHLKIILSCLEIERPHELIRKLDPLNQGCIPFSELSNVIEMKNKSKSSEDDLRRAFALMDKDGKGFLTMQDLKRINDETQEKMSEEELDEMLQDADMDGLGVVTEDNFVTFMLNAQEDAIKCNCTQNSLDNNFHP